MARLRERRKNEPPPHKDASGVWVRAAIVAILLAAAAFGGHYVMTADTPEFGARSAAESEADAQSFAAAEAPSPEG